MKALFESDNLQVAFSQDGERFTIEILNFEDPDGKRPTVELSTTSMSMLKSYIAHGIEVQNKIRTQKAPIWKRPFISE